MKIAAISAIVLASTSCVTAYEGHVERELVVGGDIFPGTKTYMAGLRVERDSDSMCGGSLITPTHVLTASHCTDTAPRWVSIGEHFKNGTELGEQIKIVSMMNHPNYSENVPMSDDFMIIELEKPSKFKPVKLAAADDSDFNVGKVATALGWGMTAPNGSFSYELKHVDMALASDKDCKTLDSVNPPDSSMVCAGGVANQSTCNGDSGGPLIVKSAEGEDVLVGVASWVKECGREGDYSVFSRVSSVRAWIETVTSGICRS
ncbi:Serine protease trypsin-like protein [Phytophthora megakarya]|uniref:Serine protease trypsin-like protein n=1 Tax=Phytophthora megakarya TaxID=4795 RepID=A0A225VJS1_9STRA|nr:Serine protease trypsin-like protein [Phytophthora megakarya]